MSDVSPTVGKRTKPTKHAGTGPKGAGAKGAANAAMLDRLLWRAGLAPAPLTASATAARASPRLALLVFGPRRLPELGRSAGATIRDFRESISGPLDEAGADTTETLQSITPLPQTRMQSPRRRG